MKKDICLVASLDIISAYDNVQMHLLCDALTRLGVPIKLTNFIDASMFARLKNVSDNNEVADSRVCNKGLRQGYYLAPYMKTGFTNQ